MIKKRTIFIICIIAIILVVTNFVLLLTGLFKESTGGLIATIISGWISGIATLFVGIIAYKQNKFINESNNRVIQEQINLDKNNLILQQRLKIVSQIENAALKYTEILTLRTLTSDFNKEVASSNKNWFINCCSLISKTLDEFLSADFYLVESILYDYMESDKKKKAKEKIKECRKKFGKLMIDLTKLGSSNFKQEYEKITEKFANDFGDNVIEIIDSYMTFLHYDLDTSIIHLSNNNDELVKKYALLKEKEKRF